MTATTLPTLLLAWEVMGATSYALIGFRWREQHRVGSGLTAFVTTRAADLGLYAAAGAAVAGGAGLDLDALPSATPGWRDVIALGVLVAALGKAAQLVLAFWLSRAMDGPSPVSALLHSAAMVAMGGYLLLRLEPLLAATGWAATTAAWAGALTAVVLGLVALGQRDLKQLLAASTSAQLGYVVMAAGLGATAAGTAHLVAHAATKAGLFLAAGAWLSALGTKQLDGLRGTVGEWPVVRVAASVALLALAGVPPLSLWATKDLVLAAAMEHSVALYAVGMVGALLSAAYAGAALRVLWAPVGDEERRRAADAARHGGGARRRRPDRGHRRRRHPRRGRGRPRPARRSGRGGGPRQGGRRYRHRADRSRSSSAPPCWRRSASASCGDGRRHGPGGPCPGSGSSGRRTWPSCARPSRWRARSTAPTSPSPRAPSARSGGSWPSPRGSPGPTTGWPAGSTVPRARPRPWRWCPGAPTTAGSTAPSGPSSGGSGRGALWPGAPRPGCCTSTTSRPSRSSRPAPPSSSS